jgi:predicted DNA-binding transcriptional regulator AlpA
MAQKCEPPPLKLMYSIPEACCLAGIGRSLFYALMLKGKGPRSVKVGSRTLIPHYTLIEWAKAQ